MMMVVCSDRNRWKDLVKKKGKKGIDEKEFRSLTRWWIVAWIIGSSIAHVTSQRFDQVWITSGYFTCHTLTSRERKEQEIFRS